MESSILSTSDHSRDAAGLKYVYPVISRRSGGLSIGINFNTNNACNWRCIYCQVPNLSIGTAPKLNFHLLEDELRFFLQDVLHGDFYERFQIERLNQVIKDIAISGNGEPTSLKEFAKAVDLIGRVATEFKIFPLSRFVLITNGSLVHQHRVQEGLKILRQYNGEVWFKFDSATDAGRKLINNARQGGASAFENLRVCAELCQTKLQVCLVDYNQAGFSAEEHSSMLNLLELISKSVSLNEVLLYTIKRPSLQPEASKLSPLSGQYLNDFADEIRLLGLKVSVSL